MMMIKAKTEKAVNGGARKLIVDVVVFSLSFSLGGFHCYFGLFL